MSMVTCLSVRIRDTFKIARTCYHKDEIALRKVSDNLTGVVNLMFDNGLLWNSEKIELLERIQRQYSFWIDQEQ